MTRPFPLRLLRLRIPALAIWAALAAAAHSLPAQTLLAQIQLGEQSVFVGEPFALRLRVVGNVRPGEPDVSLIRDFDVEYVGRSADPSHRETIFRYVLRALRAGSLEIPPIAIFGGGAKTKTAPARVEARPPENPRGYQLSVEPARETAYLGQQIVVNFEFECGREVAGIEFDAPFLKDARFIAFLVAVPFRGRLPEGYERVWVNGAPMAARRELRGAANQSARAGNEGRQVIRFEAIVIPQRVGRILLPPTTVRAALLASAATSAPRGPELTKISSLVEGDLSGGGQRAFVSSASSSLLVHELPDQGRPSNFTGLVGRHDVAAEVDRAAITFGDPLELTVSLSGQPYLAKAALPDLRNTAGLSADFEVRRADEFTTLERSRKVFRYRLRPKRSGDLAIPAIVYSYFDPGSGRYVSTHSAPLVVPVGENRVVTEANAEGPSMAILDPPKPGPAATNSAEPRSDAANDTPSSNDGKRGGPESALSLDSVAVDSAAVDSAAVDSMTVASLLSGVVRTVRSPLVVGGLLAPPLVLLLIWLAAKAAKRRSRHSVPPAEPSPWEAFEKEFATRVRQDTGPAASAAALALFREFAARHCGLAASSMTFRDLAPRLEARGVSPNVLTRVRDLFAAADAVRYGTGSARTELTPAEMRSLAREIEIELQRLPIQPR